MLTKINYEVKGQLAKLLATEDLIIENRKVETAMFDVTRRVLTLPMWEKASASVYDLLVGHEVGHALFTPADDFRKKYPELPMSYVNILEDVRIEKLMKRKYAGIVKTFFTGYRELAEQDFFELDQNDVEDMILPDRLNIHHKIGKFVDVPFSDTEQYFRDKALITETFDEVVELAHELYVWLLEQAEDSMESFAISDDEGDGTGEPTLQDMMNASPSDSQGESIQVPYNQPSSETEEGEVSEEQDPMSNTNMGGEHADLETITDKSLSDNLENLNNRINNHSREPEYCTIPDINLDNLHVTNTEVHNYLDEHWAGQQDHYDKNLEENKHMKSGNIYGEVDNEYRLFRRSAQKEVNYLVKEFECRKSADAYARATVSKTGILDCTKLHSYKYNEDLFIKITTLPDGKNHGLIFILDWSGSMSNVLMDTVKQLFNLIWFCKKAQIPFSVFAFTNEWNRCGYENYRELPDHHEYKDGQLMIEAQFSMIEFLSSDCKKGDLEKQLTNIWRLTSILDGRQRWNCNYYFQYPSRLSLSGTPLNEALLSMNKLIPLFQKRTGVQKIQCITLTDGEAHPLQYNKLFQHSLDRDPYMGSRSTMGGNVYIRDNNGKTYFCSDSYFDLTGALILQLRGQFPNVNFIGIRVLESRESSSFIRRYSDWDQTKASKLQQEWRKNKSLMIEDGGNYHAYFGLSSSALNSDSSFEVKDDATKAQIKSAFKKSLSAKKMNKKVLGQFMAYIA